MELKSPFKSLVNQLVQNLIGFKMGMSFVPVKRSIALVKLALLKHVRVRWGRKFDKVFYSAVHYHLLACQFAFKKN